MSKNIVELRNLGPSSAKALSRIGVNNLKELKSYGAIGCYEALLELNGFKPSLNFLYAMLGAIEDKHWTEYKSQKGALLIELENNKELKNLFSDND